MSTTHPPGQEPPLELQEIERTEGTMMDDLDLPEERRGLRAWLPWIAGVVIFVATIAVLYGLEGGINHFVNGFRAKERAAEQGRIVYEAGSKDVVPNVVFIDSHPPGAIVRVNGQKLGRTPLIVQRKLDGDTVRVQLDADGRKSWIKEVPVVHGGIHVEARLQR